MRQLKFRVILSNGARWVTAADGPDDARRLALRHCAQLRRLFGVHVVTVERIPDPD